MFTSIPALRTELQGRLVEALPDDWEVVKDLTATTVQLVPAVYIEFVALDTTYDGQPLGRGQVAASVDVVVVDTRTADGEGEQGVEDLIVPVLLSIDGHPDLAWKSAKKERLDSGQFAWRITTNTLVNITT